MQLFQGVLHINSISHILPSPRPPSPFSSPLQLIELQNNHLTGSLPETLDGLVTCTSFYVYNNKLTGAVPSGLMAIPNLK